MAVNRFDKAAEAAFINTYTPIDFGALYQIGAANNAAVEKALKELSTNLAKWSEFQSPSAVDTQKYYDLTVGHLKDTIQKAAENPDFLKTAAGRAELQGMINSVDYASLNQLKQSADNLRAGLEMRAKMEAEGLYNKDWDDSDIANYNTLGTGKVFTDITPVKYMTANQLSTPYFDNLKRGDIGSTWQDGVKYRMIGNTAKDLEEIFDRYGNDMANTPLGRKYIQSFMSQGMDEKTAVGKFREMIIGSQMDRTLRPELKVDPGWEMQMRAAISGRKSGSGKKEETTGITRQGRMNYDTSNKFETVAKNMPQQYHEKLAVAASGLQGIADALRLADEAYQKNPSQENLVARQQLEYQYNQAKKDLRSQAYSDILKDEFKNAAKFDVTKNPQDSKSFSRSGYNRGVKAALDKVSVTTGLTSVKDGGDKLLTLVGGNPITRTTPEGVQNSMYEFGDSSGFVLPKMLFANATGTSQPKAKRNAGAFEGDALPFEENLLLGNFRNVNFIPANENNLVEFGGNMYVKGKLQIPVEQVEDALGTGIGFWTGTAAGILNAPGSIGTGIHAVAPFTRGSTKSAIKQNYGLREVEYGEDGTPYYEIDIYKKLPKNDTMSYWQAVNVLRENTPSHGGIGSASMAQDISGTSLESIYNYSQYE